MATHDKDALVFKNILFPTDCSEGSEGAAACALSLAGAYGAKLFVLHVVDISLEPSGFYVPHMSYEKLDKEGESAEAKLLRKYCARVFRGFMEFESIILSGEPHKEILKVADEKDIDVIVMGSGARGGVDRLFFGSTAEKVLKKSTVPVLVIPPSS
ncbi:MAG: universal stress protein [Thermodesulfobacteriota bacterium]